MATVEDDDGAPASFEVPSDPEFPSDDRVYLVHRWPNRWHEATVAAALTFPADEHDGVDEWERVLDTIDAAVRLCARR